MIDAEELAGFVEWGGRAWQQQVAAGLGWLGDVSGLRILEVGTRHGGMATLFATRGARVTALDISADTFEAAEARARAHGVGDRVEFRTYSGMPRDLPTGFDVVFAKSTLVLMGDMDAIGQAIAASLVPDGRLVAIENAQGPLPLHVARMIRRGSVRPHGASYFTRRSVDRMGMHLDIALERWTAVPPTVLIGARRR